MNYAAEHYALLVVEKKPFFHFFKRTTRQFYLKVLARNEAEAIENAVQIIEYSTEKYPYTNETFDIYQPLPLVGIGMGREHEIVNNAPTILEQLKWREER